MKRLDRKGLIVSKSSDPLDLILFVVVMPSISIVEDNVEDNHGEST